ncbi:MAG TPA: ribosomal protein S18-alanine N-acetyltransferase [Polyangiaceae bacterium]|nr:ribosomal protein S18-alanine N-acetyltransferase [Polyangiaceae bacterium]
MSGPVHIEPMTEADVAAVAAIGTATRMDEAQVRDELARTWSREWVARERGVGVVAFLVAWHVADELHVLNVTTRSDRRRRGIGRALMNTLLSYGRDHRVRRVVLEVRRSNAPAIALYRTIGFFAVGVRARYYPDDEDAIEMMLLLDPDTGAIVAREDEVHFDA